MINFKHFAQLLSHKVSHILSPQLLQGSTFEKPYCYQSIRSINYICKSRVLEVVGLGSLTVCHYWVFLFEYQGRAPSCSFKGKYGQEHCYIMVVSGLAKVLDLFSANYLMMCLDTMQYVAPKCMFPCAQFYNLQNHIFVIQGINICTCPFCIYSKR